jgi:hypothetical protein
MKRVKKPGAAFWATVVVAVALGGYRSLVASAKDKRHSERTEKEQKPGAEALKAMRERAESVTVLREAAQGEQPDEPQPLKLLAEPLLHYSDREVNILNGSLWAWGETGRPQAFLKTAAHVWGGDDPPRVTWVTWFVSTSHDLLTTKWENGLRYKTREPGLKLETIPKGPKPAAAKLGRLAQMKELARRFSVRSGDFTHSSSRSVEAEMRLMPTPVHRYADPEAGILDGTVLPSRRRPQTRVYCS